MIALIAVASVWACAQGAVCGADKPEPLLKAELARARLSTAKIEFSIHTRPSADDSGKSDGQTLFYSFQGSPGEYLVAKRGDMDGVVQRDQKGRPANLTYNGLIRLLARDGVLWRHVDEAPNAIVTPGTEQWSWMFDIRRIGLNPVTESASHALEDMKLSYGAVVEDGQAVVTAKLDNGSGEFRWWIDPAKDWAITRTAVLDGGRVLGERRFEYRQFDGYWFPSRVELVRIAAGDAAPSTVIEILAAEFNRPNHPLELTPEHIGVEVGTQITFADGRRPSIGFWDGRSAVPMEELTARLERGELSPGLTYAREVARARLRSRREAALAGAAKNPDSANAAGRWQDVEGEWERYTRRFIQHFRLDDEQTAAALRLLRECQDLAREHISRHRDQFEALDRVRARHSSAHERAGAEAALARLLEPLDAIFRDTLRPKLDKLPSRRQKAEAGEFKP